MKKNQHYTKPEMDFLPMSYLDMLCESPEGTSGSTEDYELITDFEW